jgi:hypothetical protein
MFQTVTVAFLLTDRYASRASVVLLLVAHTKRLLCRALLVESVEIHGGTKGPHEQNNSNVLKCTDAPPNVYAQWYIMYFECIDVGDPLSMPLFRSLAMFR